jgi:hypothetical protein
VSDLRNCGTCIFAVKLRDPQGNPGILNECHRYPPHVVLLPGQPIGVAAWPLVQDNHFCGEHEQRTNGIAYVVPAPADEVSH